MRPIPKARIKLTKHYNLKLTRRGMRLTNSPYSPKAVSKTTTKTVKQSDNTDYAVGSYVPQNESTLGKVVSFILDCIEAGIYLTVKGMMYFFYGVIGLLLTGVILLVAYFFVQLFLWLIGVNVF